MSWLAGWSKRIKLTVAASDVDDDLTWFPIHIYLSATCGKGDAYDLTPVFDEVGANSKKIALTLVDGLTQLYIEIDKWDNGNEKAWLHTGLDSHILSSSLDNGFYLYYDNDHADNDTYVGIPNSTPAENVWDSYFELVCHMQDDPDTSHVRDSTSNDEDGTKKGAGEPAEADGYISKGQLFDGSDDYILKAGFDPDYTNGVCTWEGLVYATSSGARVIFEQGANAHSLQNNEMRIRESDGSQIYTSWTVPSTDNWHYIVGVADGSYLTGYVDTVQSGTPTAYDGTLRDWNQDLLIGKSDTFGTRIMVGKLDEIRLSNTDRSTAWITATYDTLRDEFITYGSEETRETVQEQVFNILSYPSLSLTHRRGVSTLRPAVSVGEVSDRRFYNYIKQLRVGVSSSSHSYVTSADGLGPLEFEIRNPWLITHIPGAAAPVYQFIINPVVEASIDVRSLETIIQLLKTVDVSSEAGTQVAVSTSDRNSIDYFAVEVYTTEINNTSDARDAESIVFKFNNARIRNNVWKLGDWASPIKIKFYADSVSERLPTTAWWILTIEDLSIASRESQTFSISTSEDVSIATRQTSDAYTITSSEDISITTRESQVFSITTEESITVE